MWEFLIWALSVVSDGNNICAYLSILTSSETYLSPLFTITLPATVRSLERNEQQHIIECCTCQTRCAIDLHHKAHNQPPNIQQTPQLSWGESNENVKQDASVNNVVPLSWGCQCVQLQC